MVALSISMEGWFGLTWPDWKRLLTAIEQLGFAGLFLSDHFLLQESPTQPSLELVVALTYLFASMPLRELGTDRNAIMGTPEEVIAQIRAYAAVGVEEVLVQLKSGTCFSVGISLISCPPLSDCRRCLPLRPAGTLLQGRPGRVVAPGQYHDIDPAPQPARSIPYWATADA